jgi:hypothetical protein
MSRNLFAADAIVLHVSMNIFARMISECECGQGAKALGWQFYSTSTGRT